MAARHAMLGFVLAIAVACGGTPTTPAPIPPPVIPPPVVNNTPPVIGKFTVQGTRTNEPPNFADVLEDLPISVEVTDAEDDSKFTWSATANGASLGSFTGAGRSVTWKAPAEAPAPVTVTINLKVVETYTSEGKSAENKVTGSTTLRLHNSVKEVGDMARQFLLDFSDSNKDVATTMRNFQPGCYGTDEETSQVSDNRMNFTIIDSNVGASQTTVAFGGTCPFRNKPGDACARVPVYWKSVAKKDVYNPNTGNLDVRSGATTEAGPGVDQLAAIYYRDQQQWKLCDSQFDPDHTSLRAAEIRGMVP